MKESVLRAVAVFAAVINILVFSVFSFSGNTDGTSSAPVFDNSDNIYSVSVFSPKSVYRDELVGGADIDFSVYRNGVKLASDEISSLDISVSADGRPFEREILSDGTVRVRVYGLTASSFLSTFAKPLSPFFLKTGDCRVRLTFYSSEDNMTVGNSATVCVLPEPFGRYVFYVFLPFLVLFIALGYVFKSRFGKKYRLLAFDVTEIDGKLSFSRKEKKNPAKVGFRSFVPYIRNKAYVGGVKVAAYGVFRKKFYIRSTNKLLSFSVLPLTEIENNGLTLPETRKKGAKKSHIIFSAGEAVLLKTSDGFVCVAAKEVRPKRSENSYKIKESSVSETERFEEPAETEGKKE